jgi:lipid-binding SYLF domain-containing protein
MDPYQQNPPYQQAPPQASGALPAKPTEEHPPKKGSAFWDKAKHGSKGAFDKAWAGFEKLGAPVNKLTHKIGSEAFWPTGLGPESDKAARILKSFCKDGFYKEQPASRPGTPGTSTGPKSKPKVLVKIPQKVIQNCVGLAIFTVMRTGLWVSGAGGSGVLIAKKEDGSWSPPSGILIHTLGVGFMAGIDIYDCVVVINNRKALEAFSKLRVSLGGELSVVAGPVGVGGILESEVMKDRKPIWTYVKSRGLYGGLQIDGTIIVERNDENAKFYNERIPVGQILAGNVRHVPQDVKMLMEVLKAAEGRTDIDSGIMAQADAMPPPGDVEVEKMSEPTNEQKVFFAPPPGYTHEQAPPQPPRPGTEGAYAAASYSAAGYGAGAPAYQSPHGADGSHGSSSGAAYGAGEYPQEKPPHRTDSGFPVPPPGPPPHRTDSGFPAPPGPPPSQGKQDPDGPPRYA